LLIKLIASDMDGTFLAPDCSVPQGSFDLINQLREQGVMFVAASGRRYDSLHTWFGPIADQIAYVASSGAQVYDAGHLVGHETFSHAALYRLKRMIDVFDTLHLLVFDDTHTFMLDDVISYMPELDKDMPHQIRVDDLPAPQVPIIKASIYCDESPMDMAYVLSRELGSDFVFAPSGRRWIDVLPLKLNKAQGLEQIMRLHDIAPQEVVAFGDSMNDYELLRMAGTGIAVSNARYALRQIADRVIDANASMSVQATMQTILDGSFIPAVDNDE
jgi:Cof subfamily protein (haloacid dehalogenase superfamily)